MTCWVAPKPTVCLESFSTRKCLPLNFYRIAADLKRRNDNEHTYSTRNNLERAISYYEEYYKLASKIENKEGLIEAPKGLGNCYMELEKYDNALKSYEKSAQRAIEFKDDIRKAEAFCQIIKALILKGDGKEKEEEKKGEKPDMIQGVKEPQGEVGVYWEGVF